MSASSTLSLRLPRETGERLERAVQLTHRSAVVLAQEAIDKYLDTLLEDKDRSIDDRAGRLAHFLSYRGVGVGADGGRSIEDIDAQVREFRGDD